MKSSRTLVVLFAAAWLGSAVASDSRPPVRFNRDVRPILAESCLACHGPDAAKRQADLRLDRRESAVESKAIVPGKAAQSALLARITSTDPDEQMPPPSAKKARLSAAQIELLRRWIDQGAVYEPHWAYAKPARPALPVPQDPRWSHNPIDAFVAAGLEQHALRPAPEADRRTLARRLSFDLVGLPPKAEEVDRFAADRSPGAYQKLVDRLLAAPQYGERMAVCWLDVARYADSCGYHSDNERSVWMYRDWVIRAFNENKPFDQFTLEQLAGDLLPAATDSQRIASGYNRLLQTTEEGGAQPKEYTAKFAADRVRNTATAWLGVTLGCAQCHDHKYDPFTTRDFYSLAAFFADVKELPVGRQVPTPFPSPLQAAAMARLRAEMAPLEKSAAKPAPAVREKLAALKRQREALEKAIPTTLVTESVEPRVARILPRGNWMDDSGPIVGPAIPAVFGRIGDGKARPTRRDLAAWLVSADNPLVARVFVNRLWNLFFGQGIARNLDDLGTQGALPTHPELLDWLAVEFRTSGWDVKHMVRLIVTSQAYRQSSAATAELARSDPGNQYLGRQGRFRIDAEAVRDLALSAAGLLSLRVGGPSVKPYQPAGYWEFLNFPKRHWEADRGENQYRRGLYTHWQRTLLHPSLLAFDACTREESTPQRARSNTPLQALVLLNDPTYVEASRVLAARAVREGGRVPQGRVAFVFRQLLQRQPSAEEANLLVDLYEKHLGQYRAEPKAAAALIGVGDAASPPGADAAELAAWTSVARVVLNLHETITRD